MLELAVRPQVVAPGVRRPAQRTLEPAREVHVVVVPYVRYHFAAQLAPVQIAAARQTLKRQPHVPGLGACRGEIIYRETQTHRERERLTERERWARHRECESESGTEQNKQDGACLRGAAVPGDPKVTAVIRFNLTLESLDFIYGSKSHYFVRSKWLISKI